MNIRRRLQKERALERAQGIRVHTPLPYLRGRIYEAAVELSNAGNDAQRVELVNESLAALFRLLYEVDEAGHYPNLDNVTGKIIIPVPWGSRTWRGWKSIRRWEANLLRAILLGRQSVKHPNRKLNPLVYDEVSRSWWLNRASYPTLEDALAWLEKNEVSVSEWRNIAVALRRKDAERKRRV